MSQPRILLVVGGGIAAYKACELVRLIRKGGGDVTCVLTHGGAQFVTPMSLAALSGNQVHTSLWDLQNETEIGHIQLSRQADLVVVCPATADLMAKMAAGICDDLATTLILATDKPVLAVPAMNVRMWQHPATRRNIEWLRQAGVHVLEPDEGPMACGEFGPGRLPEPEMVWLEIADLLGLDPGHAGAAEIGHYIEALEPEDEPELELADPHEAEQAEEPVRGRMGGLAGLLSSIIPRSTPRRIEPDEVQWDDAAFALPDPASLPPASPGLPGPVATPPLAEQWPGEFAGDLPDGSVLPAPVDPLAGGLVLAKKGKAKSAPPTDMEAINHTVNANQVAPEHFADQRFAGAPPGPLADGVLTGDELLDDQPDFADDSHRPLYGRHVLVTAGPTHEPIDPVRYIANRSSGKQGFAIAAAAARAGARVTLVAGPVSLPTPPGVDRIDVESAREMADAVKARLPADVAIMVAAVADWRTRDYVGEKIKKRGSAPPALLLEENPDILATVASRPDRPRLVIGFAAETENVVPNATRKRKSKGVDWIVANDVSGGKGHSVMGGDSNTVHLVREGKVEHWQTMSKDDVAQALVDRLAVELGTPADD